MSTIQVICQQITDQIKHEMEGRAFVAANELRNESQDVLRGQRSGRIYRVPGNKATYTASAPGEPPAVRTGLFRLKWAASALVESGTYISRITNEIQVGKDTQYTLGELLENGTSKMAPRPHHDRILEGAEPKIVKIYAHDYDL